MILLQASTAIDSTAAAAAATEGIQFFDLVMKGGWVMFPLAFLFFATVFLIVERWLAINSNGKIDESFVDNIKDFIRQGNIKSAESLCRNQKSAAGRVFEKAVGRIGYSIKDIESTVENAGQIEVAKMESNLAYLGVIAGIAPMLGFVGTISGIINIFYSISQSNDFNIGTVAGGMYEKMITSGAGLIVGLIAYMGYHLLNMKLDRFALKLQGSAFDFLDVLQKPVK
ncbi:MAG: MotA/TolQ/ExbB proton channel family protein [Runella slithyformis]|nr:MAG: MotA/TolQ/ExbB proton channel family protein [Runella slithyformis]TAF95217.1 MAG: MotA/TolQ/ExbB proton channel family protein [Runella sp.]TAG24758.1 MAG: MotA/TolQ/ExbB proton channel family protein [Cytophagales bacterium]TAG40056.1 MAG: MotA/TolQ/ExbB proton channel family protein [Cytophagia bacterium]TAF00701.1 MAG: MotA/TolQ/ExbB proton channel family protein [Runella slithyformis]